MIRINGNGIRSEQDLRTQVTKIMQHHLKISMHLIEDRDFSLRSRGSVMVGNLYSVGIVMESIIGDIVHRIRVVCLISILHKNCK